MGEGKRGRWIHTPQLEDVPELIHRIQSLLPVNEATPTCVLSKSWLHAWSTIYNLRFRLPTKIVSQERDSKYTKLIDSTLQRYLRDNIPIELFDLDLDITNKELASFAKTWIQSVASKKSCLKELSLAIFVTNISGNYFTLPDGIFSCENLNTVSVRVNDRVINSRYIWSKLALIDYSNRVINCVSLRVLELLNVDICEVVLAKLFSTCTLLEKINLDLYSVETIEIRNLRYLRELKIKSKEKYETLEIGDIPSLRRFFYISSYMRPLPFNMDSLGSVTELILYGVITGTAFLDMLNSKLPLLVTLTLDMWNRSPEKLNITSASLKRLVLKVGEDKQNNIQVYAPKLLYFSYNGKTMPSLLFQTVHTSEQIRLVLKLRNLFDHSFYLKLREALSSSSSKFDVEIIDVSRAIEVPFKISINDLRRRVLFPATNVRQLSFKLFSGKSFWEHSAFLDALFVIIHPNYVKASPGPSFIYLYKLMVSRMQEKRNIELKDVEIKNYGNGQWETLANSWKSFRNRSSDPPSSECKLNWCF